MSRRETSALVYDLAGWDQVDAMLRDHIEEALALGEGVVAEELYERRAVVAEAIKDTERSLAVRRRKKNGRRER